MKDNEQNLFNLNLPSCTLVIHRYRGVPVCKVGYTQGVGVLATVFQGKFKNNLNVGLIVDLYFSNFGKLLF